MLDFYYVVSATETSILPGNMPTAAAIESALNGIGAVTRSPSRSWLSQQSRITRTNIPTRVRGFGTTFARILKFTLDPPYSQDYVNGLARDVGVLVQDAIKSISTDWGPVSVTNYVAAVNGPLSWWDGSNPTGSAYNTRTRDTPGSALSGATLQDENPLGPDNAIPATPTDLQALQAIGQGIGGAVGNVLGGATAPLARNVQSIQATIITVAVVAAGAVGLYLAWPWISGVRATKYAKNRYGASARRSVYRNPWRRRKRRRHAA